MASCERCGKGKTFGRNVSHSKHHTSRTFLPNIHRATVVVNGKAVRMDLCTRCLRTLTKAG
jgi:large subunit ribosomal protein L28